MRGRKPGKTGSVKSSGDAEAKRHGLSTPASGTNALLSTRETAPKGDACGVCGGGLFSGTMHAAGHMSEGVRIRPSATRSKRGVEVRDAAGLTRISRGLMDEQIQRLRVPRPSISNHVESGPDRPTPARC